MLRDGKTKEEVEKVISNQFSYDKIAPEANIEIINNDGTVQELKNKLIEAIGKITKHRNWQKCMKNRFNHLIFIFI